jgi:CYTH domain-containing protein
MIELERELSYLINELPENLNKFPSKIIEDNYIPREADHPVIRIRRDGDNLFITKKYPKDTADGVGDGDSSHMIEHTIPLSRAEYEALNSCDGRRFKKRRFAYEIDGHKADLDVYLDKLAGLAVIDFEFKSEEEMNSFKKPNFVGADITQDHSLAGGMLCGKSYADITGHLKAKYDYEPIAGAEKCEEVK